MGAHKNPRRKLTQTSEEFEAQDLAAEQEDLSWAEWARGILTEAAWQWLKEESEKDET